jgi:beta-lactamase regulating signal transducer with metallopeptidase domain
MIALALDHLWQSTLFAAGAGLLTLALRNHAARIRFWLWFSASLKFLIPFAALTAIGSHLLVSVAPQMSAPGFFVMQPAAQPFSAPMSALSLSGPAATGPHLTLLLLVLWSTGVVAILARWLIRWYRLRGILRVAVDMPVAAPVIVKQARSSIEPGLVGVWKPVILLPQGITERLYGAEMDVIIAHEICHLRRRDNLLAATHMLVEALFWFHPLVWWLGARLNAERERACDESVLASGRSPHVYAEAILKICKLYLHSPLACASGVSGADLKSRIEIIMESRTALRLDVVRKLFLGASATTAIAIPLALGLVKSPLTLAQAEPIPSPTTTAERRAEQAVPRKIVPFDPKHFDKYVGYYQMGPSTIFTVTRDGEHFLSRLTGQVNVEFFPESETKFFATEVSAQISFATDGQGRATELVLHQAGLEQHAPRVDESVAKNIEAALAQRIKNNTPSPGTESALRHQVEAEINDRPDYGTLMPGLGAATREQWPVIQQLISSLGSLKSITFRSVSPGGADVYNVVFERGRTQWYISPLSPDGKIQGLFWHRLP